MILLGAVAGCAGTPEAMGLPWWSQAPGAAIDADPAREPSTPPAPRYADAVRYGDLLFVSGQVADDPVSQAIVGSGIEAQTRTAMANVVRILESHGLAASNILSVTLYLQDLDELPSADAVYASYFRHSLPARSVVRVEGLPRDSLIEIAVIAGK
jgi:2-iminobutanoate/2-iminopropanoate deaminase